MGQFNRANATGLRADGEFSPSRHGGGPRTSAAEARTRPIHSGANRGGGRGTTYVACRIQRVRRAARLRHRRPLQGRCAVRSKSEWTRHRGVGCATTAPGCRARRWTSRRRRAKHLWTRLSGDDSCYFHSMSRAAQFTYVCFGAVHARHVHGRGIVPVQLTSANPVLSSTRASSSSIRAHPSTTSIDARD
jgi:hypothetical protein